MAEYQIFDVNIEYDDNPLSGTYNNISSINLYFSDSNYPLDYLNFSFKLFIDSTEYGFDLISTTGTLSSNESLLNGSGTNEYTKINYLLEEEDSPTSTLTNNSTKNLKLQVFKDNDGDSTPNLIGEFNGTLEQVLA